MKPHIQRTIEDLTTELHRLQWMIDTLKSYGEQAGSTFPPSDDDLVVLTSAGRTAADLIRNTPRPRGRPGKTLTGPNEGPRKSGAPEAAQRPLSDAAPALPCRSRAEVQASKGSFRTAVLDAARNVPSPFTSGDIRDWLKARMPAVLRSAGRSTLGSSLCALVAQGVIRDAGKRDGRCAYRLASAAPAKSAPASKDGWDGVSVPREAAVS